MSGQPEAPSEGDAATEAAAVVGGMGPPLEESLAQVDPGELHILVADHSEEDRRELRQQLEHIGFAVIECV